MSIFEYDQEVEERKLRQAEFEAGEQSGMQKGIQLKTKEVASALMKKGVSLETIAEILGISEKEVQELLKKE